MVAHLPFGEQQHDGSAFTVTHGMELGVQPAFGAPDTSGKSPPSRAVFDRYGSLRGFPSGVTSDSESVLVKEAGMDGSTFIVGFACSAFGGD